MQAFLFCIRMITSFLIDLCIIFFANTSVLNKFGVFCYRRAAYSVGIVGVCSIVGKQIIHNSFDCLDFRWQPTVFTSILRIAAGKPIVLGNDQYGHDRIIRKYLTHITPEQYSLKYNNIVSQIDSSKTNKILKDNWGAI